MRSFFAVLLACGVPISIGIAVACGPPASFDNLTGGAPADAGLEAEASIPLVTDPSIGPPRPLAPLSGSWINGSRPRFRWEPSDREALGAHVIVCPDAKCADPAKNKEWPATGRELTAPEDLAPGRYFWHLVTTTDSSIGTTTSATWMMIVRGGAGKGVPAGAIGDYNGDGIADLIVAADFDDPSGTPLHDALLFQGTSYDDPIAVVTDINDDRYPRDLEVGDSPNLRVAATDIDGDGISDAIFADFPAGGGGGGPPRGYFLVYHGTPTLSEDLFAFAPPFLPAIDVLPSMAAPGDIDGDGHGDLVTSTRTTTLALYGAPDNLSTFQFIDKLDDPPFPDGGQLPPPSTAIAIDGFDFNSDGLSDIAVASYYADEGLYVNLSIPGRSYGESDIFGDPSDGGSGALTPATIIRSGDFDGDGTTDIVFASVVAGKPSICAIANPDGARGGARACWSPDPAPAGFASSMISVDVEGDGKDEILVGSAGGGVDVLRRTGPDKLEAEHLAIDFGTSMTVLDPGRPRPAVWVATRADGSAIAFFQGKELKRTVTASSVLSDFAGPALRFQTGIR